MSLIDLLFTAYWFFLPAGFANMSPVLLNKVPVINRWNTPIDFGKTWQGKRIFGNHKTWRGLVAGMLIATLTIGLQKLAYTHWGWAYDHSWFVYSKPEMWLLGPLFGAGALLGDAIESFFKRHHGVAPGEAWFPFDQIDYIVGGLLLTAPLTYPSLNLMLAVLAVYFGLHLLASYVGYLTGFKKTPV